MCVEAAECINVDSNIPLKKCDSNRDTTNFGFAPISPIMLKGWNKKK